MASPLPHPVVDFCSNTQPFGSPTHIDTPSDAVGAAPPLPPRPPRPGPAHNHTTHANRYVARTVPLYHPRLSSSAPCKSPACRWGRPASAASWPARPNTPDMYCSAAACGKGIWQTQMRGDGRECVRVRVRGL